MKRFVALTLTALLLCPSVVIAQGSAVTLRNADVLQMVKAKIAPDVIVAKIKSSPCNFDTFPTVLSELKYRGVPDEVLMAMVNAPNGPPKTNKTITAGTESATAPEVPVTRIVLRDGTDMAVVTTEEISSKTATEGDPVNFKVEEDVKVDGQVVIRAGTLVKGEVANSTKSGRLGKGGQLSIRVNGTRAVDGQRVRLRASRGKTGDDKTGTTVVLVVLFGVLGFLKKGKNAVIKPGTRIPVYVDDDFAVAVPQLALTPGQ